MDDAVKEHFESSGESNMVGLDYILPSIIYVLLRAQVHELPAILKVVLAFTLDKRHEAFEQVQFNFEAAC